MLLDDAVSAASRSHVLLRARATLRASPPAGDAWIHEIKFDGYRVQLHKTLSSVSLFSKGGYDFRRKFQELASVPKAPRRRASSTPSPTPSRHVRRYAGRWDERKAEKASNAGPKRRRKADMTDSTGELMKSYEVIKSVVMRHSHYDAARILTLNLATSITADRKR